MYIYPVLVGSTRVKETLIHSRQLGYKVFPNRAILNINAATTATRQLIIGAYQYCHVRSIPPPSGQVGCTLAIF